MVSEKNHFKIVVVTSYRQIKSVIYDAIPHVAVRLITFLIPKEMAIQTVQPIRCKILLHEAMRHNIIICDHNVSIEYVLLLTGSDDLMFCIL